MFIGHVFSRTFTRDGRHRARGAHQGILGAGGDRDVFSVRKSRLPDRV